MAAAGGESGGTVKRQKISEDSMSKQQSGEGGEVSLPPRNIPRQGGSDPGVPVDPSKPAALPESSVGQSTGDTSPLSLPQSGALSNEDMLVRCMLQMAQQQQEEESISSSGTPSSTSLAAPNWTCPPSPPLPSSSQSQGELNSAKLSANPSTMFSRGNFAPVDHLPPSLPPGSTTQPQQLRAKPGPVSAAVATSGTITSSVPTMTSSMTPSLPPLAAETSDISRLVPHLEAIAGSLQTPPSLDVPCLGALAQTHLLPALAAADPSSPQVTQLLDLLQSLPLGPEGEHAAGGVDPSSFLAGIDVNSLMQSIGAQELPGVAGGAKEGPYKFVSGKRGSQRSGGVAEGAELGEGLEVHHGRARHLTTSFLLDHNFPMDIPPPTDLLPAHVRNSSISVLLLFLLLL